MDKARFDKAFTRFLACGSEPMSPRTFLELLAETEAARERPTVVLQARVVNGQLPFEPSSELVVQANEILLAHQRIVVKVS